MRGMRGQKIHGTGHLGRTLKGRMPQWTRYGSHKMDRVGTFPETRETGHPEDVPVARLRPLA